MDLKAFSNGNYFSQCSCEAPKNHYSHFTDVETKRTEYDFSVKDRNESFYIL